MLIAIFSDSHDDLPKLNLALRKVEKLGITHAFHLGDFTSGSVITSLNSSGITWTCVWGNMDNELRNIKTDIDIVPEDYREVIIEDRLLFLTHYPSIARMAALSGKYAAVFHGHTHVTSVEMLENTLLANPGELCGTRYGKATFGIYDTDENTMKIASI